MICNLYTLVGDFLIGSKQGHVKHELLIADHRQFGIVVVVGHGRRRSNRRQLSSAASKSSTLLVNPP